MGDEGVLIKLKQETSPEVWQRGSEILAQILYLERVVSGWHADIKGEGSDYAVEIYRGQGDEVDWECSCQYYLVNGSPCKHIVGTVLRLTEEKAL